MGSKARLARGLVKLYDDLVACYNTIPLVSLGQNPPDLLKRVFGG